jgi:hypothetical protein
MRRRSISRRHRDLPPRRRAEQHAPRPAQHSRPEHAAALHETHLVESGLTGEVEQHQQRTRRAHRARAPPPRRAAPQPRRPASNPRNLNALIYPRRLAAELLNCSIATLWRLERQGRLRPIKLSASPTANTFYARADIEALIGGDHA